MAAKDQPNFRMEPGYTFPVQDFVVTTEEQREGHRFCDIPENVYGAYADPTFVARLPITLNSVAILACHPDRAPVHTVHRITQHRRVRLDESLRMAGAITSIEDHPRGWVARSRWEYRDASGDLAVVVEPDVLMVDKSRAPSRQKNGGSGAETPNDNGFQVVTRKSCTPETTKGYCAGTANLIHIDPETALRFGFRAPIIAGNQTVNFLMEAVSRDNFPDRLQVEARFMRPVFWDEDVTVEARKDSQGRPELVRARNGAGKTVADCRVYALG